MGRKPNKLGNATSLNDLFFFRHECRIFEIAHICSRRRYENQFLYTKAQFILVPPHFRLVPPHFVLSGDGTGACLPLPPRLRLWVSSLKVVWTGLAERFSKFLKS